MLLVTHGGVIRLLLCQLLEVEMEKSWHYRLDPGAWPWWRWWTATACCAAWATDRRDRVRGERDSPTVTSDPRRPGGRCLPRGDSAAGLKFLLFDRAEL